MSGRRRTRSRRIARLITIAVVGAIAVGGASTATAFALDAKPAARAASAGKAAAAAATAAKATSTPTATATTSSGAARRVTSVRGWSTSAQKATAGTMFRALVLVSGPRRTVRLERQVQGAWKAVDADRTSNNGAAALEWKVPKSATRAVLRLHVLPTDRFRAVATAQKVVTVGTTPAVTSTPTATSTATAAPATSAAETLRAQLLTLVNQARATARTCGGTAYPAVKALARSTALDTAAGDYATKMATENFFSHESPDGSTMVSRLKAVGITNVNERENIAAGQTTAQSVMTAWLNSPGHCANLMAADVTRIGLGHAASTTATYGHYWVQDFAG